MGTAQDTDREVEAIQVGGVITAVIEEECLTDSEVEAEAVTEETEVCSDSRYSCKINYVYMIDNFPSGPQKLRTLFGQISEFESFNLVSTNYKMIEFLQTCTIF